MPELITALAGVRHKENGNSLGTLVGSNITNPLVAIARRRVAIHLRRTQPLIQWDLPGKQSPARSFWAILWFSKGKLKKIHAFYLIGMYLCM
jgi:cation:H+ antiporter